MTGLTTGFYQAGSIRRKAGGLAVALAVVAGCVGSGEPVGAIRAVTQSDVPAPGHAPLSIDLRDPGLAYRFEGDISAIDFGQIELTCPNGASMPMDLWLLSQTAEGRLGSFDLFAIGLDPALVEQALVEDEPAAQPDTGCMHCYLCSDGAWICTDTCQEGRSPWDLIAGGAGEWHPTPYDPRDPEPDGEGSGSGSDDGPGPSGSISSGVGSSPSGSGGSGSGGSGSGGSGSGGSGSGGAPSSPPR